jgi:hypothetical protein
MQGILATIQTSCAELLAASPALAGVQILHEQIGDVESRVRIALAKSTGICAIVLTPSASGNSPASPGPHLDSMEVVVEVAENVVLNQSAAGTRLPASAVAEQVAATEPKVLAEMVSKLPVTVPVDRRTPENIQALSAAGVPLSQEASRSEPAAIASHWILIKPDVTARLPC